MSFFNDIIKEKHKGYYKYSQGRFYLFVSFCAFFVLNVILIWAAFAGHKVGEDQSVLIVAGNLKWALGSFALYVLGGKGIGAFRDRQTGIGNDYMHESRYDPYWRPRPHYEGYGHHGGGGYGQQDEGFDQANDYGQNVDNYKNKEEEEVENGYYMQGDEEVD